MGGGTLASRSFELRLLYALVNATEGKPARGSTDEVEITERLTELARKASEAGVRSKEAMDAVDSLGREPLMSALTLENVFGYKGPMTYEKVEQIGEYTLEQAKYTARSAAQQGGRGNKTRCAGSAPVAGPSRPRGSAGGRQSRVGAGKRGAQGR